LAFKTQPQYQALCNFINCALDGAANNSSLGHARLTGGRSEQGCECITPAHYPGIGAVSLVRAGHRHAVWVVKDGTYSQGYILSGKLLVRLIHSAGGTQPTIHSGSLDDRTVGELLREKTRVASGLDPDNSSAPARDFTEPAGPVPRDP